MRETKFFNIGKKIDSFRCSSKLHFNLYDQNSRGKTSKVAHKGQLVSKCLFGIFNSPKIKRKKSTLLLWYLKSNCFLSFFGKIEDTKNTF